MPVCAALLVVLVGNARAVTIDPGRVPLTQGALNLTAVSCPTPGQCTGVDDGGHAVTFRPKPPHRSHVITLGRCATCSDLQSVDCPAADQCTAGSQLGGEYTFDPRGGADVRHGAVGPVAAVACPSSTECVLLDGNGHERTIDPRTPAAMTIAEPIAGGVGLAIACPLATQCTDVASGAATFDPRTTPVAPVSVGIGIAGPIAAVACPRSTQCTAVNYGGSESTFDPETPTAAPRLRSLGHHYLTSVSCPSQAQCTAVDSTGATITFNPQNPSSRLRRVKQFKEADAVDCPSSAQCTVVGGQFEVSFDPGR